MQKKVAILHTSFVSVEDLRGLFAEHAPMVQVFNIVDDSLLAEVLKSGGVTSGVTNRIKAYAQQAEAMGVDLIFNQCSSVGEAFDEARKQIGIPTLKVDEPMAEEAVSIGGRITVVATVPTTLNPSVRLIERAAQARGVQLTIRRCLVEGAFEALVKEKNKAKHNELILKAIEHVVPDSDAIVLAQGSMIALLPFLGQIPIPVLSSPRSGVRRAVEMLGA